MITTSPVTNHTDKSQIIGRLQEDIYTNQLIIGDIHEPMNQLSDIFKIVHDGEIIGGWSIFRGFKDPVIVFPPDLPEAWQTIKDWVNVMNLSQFTVSFPKDTPKAHNQKPWHEWSNYKWEHMFTDNAMRLEKEEVNNIELDKLPTIRGIGIDEKEKLIPFFKEVSKLPSYTGFFNPLQLLTELYVIAEEHDEIIGVAGTHYETPSTVQIGNVYVKPEYRKRGIGKALTTAVVLGILRSYRIPTLFVNDKNDDARRLYESMGFKIYNQFEFYLGKKV